MIRNLCFIQSKRNIERFDEDMMFQLSDHELENLQSQFVTANISSMARTNPYAFTEQGIVEDYGVQKYAPIIKRLLANEVLVLP